MADRYENIRKALSLLSDAEDRPKQYTQALTELRLACDPDTIRSLLAERDALARENEAMKRCATKYLEWLGVTHMPLDQALRDDMLNPRMCGDAALAKQDTHG